MNLFHYLYFNPLVNKLNRNLKIRQKAYLAFLFMLIFLIAFGIYQYSIIQQSAQDIKNKEKYEAISQKLDEIILEIQQEEALIYADHLGANEQMLRHSDIQDNLTSKKRNLKNIAKNENIQIDLENLITFLNNYTSSSEEIFDEYIPVAQKFQIKPEEALLTEKRKLFDEFETHTKSTLSLLKNYKKKISQKTIQISQKQEQFHSNGKMMIIAFILAGIILSIIIANFVAQRITRPVEKLEKNIDVLAKGNYEFKEEFEVIDNDEIGKMVRKAEKLGETMKSAILFAEEIGKNKLNTDFNVDNKGELGKALNKMRNNLQEVTAQNEKRRQAEEKRNWVMEKTSNLSEVLHYQYENLDDFYYDIIKSLIESIDAVQGGLFIIEEKDERKTLNLKAAYAYDRKKMLSKEIEIGDGLIGTCAIEKEKIVLKEIPQDYLNITSGLGKAEPSFIIIVPLLLNDEIFGVFEIASFHELKGHEIEFLEKAAENIASAVSNAQINSKTSRLLEQTRIQAEKLSTQEEEMRQNMEELQAKQEESSRREKEMEQKLEEAYQKIAELENSNTKK